MASSRRSEPDGIDWGAADCHYGDHSWAGGGACVRCGVQLRCYCGQFVTEDGIDKHLRESCPLARAAMDEERRALNEALT